MEAELASVGQLVLTLAAILVVAGLIWMVIRAVGED